MIRYCKRPVLIVEGQGDSEAIPVLMRRTYEINEIYDVYAAPRPKQIGSIPRFLREGEMERWIQYGLQSDGDSVLVALDCEDDDPEAVRTEVSRRLHTMNRCKDKKVAFVLFVREYETMFLHGIDEIKMTYPQNGWIPGANLELQPEMYRDAKGSLSRLMNNDYAYKPTRDQARFSNCLDLPVLREKSESFALFERILLGLANGSDRTVI
ncbi:DUF4276 family protein [Starkeya sp. ORNL1]|nr:DUF4276 family protein [Starkeya sp. ORNL1]